MRFVCLCVAILSCVRINDNDDDDEVTIPVMRYYLQQVTLSVPIVTFTVTIK